jgi:hypothetical protein
MQLPDPPGRPSAAEADLAGTAGMAEGLRGRLDRDLGAEPARHRLEHSLDREEVGLFGSAAPGPRLQRADQEAGEAVGLGGWGRALSGEATRQGLLPPAAIRRREVNPARLEEGDAAGATGEAPPGSVEQGAEQRGPHRRLVFGKRIGEANRLGARVLRRDPQPRGLPGIGEAPADDLVEAQVTDLVLGAAAQSLLTGQTPALPGGVRQGGRQVLVESVDPRDLLDQVSLPGDVEVAVGRRAHLEVPVPPFDPETETLQIAGLVGLVDLHPEQAADPLRSQADRVRGRWLGGDIDRARDEPGAAELDHQPRGDPLGAKAEVGVELLLEARGGLRAEPEHP